jgi:chemotaxis protein methyltransferase CheR
VSAASPSSLIADPCFRPLKEYIIALSGLAYYADKDADLSRTLLPRLDACRREDCASYLALLCDPAEGPREFDNLIAVLTIGETFFFRHAELFEALLAVVLPDLIARNRSHRRLRIWSAGCSTGAEPYSLAILLRRELASELAGWDITLIATDINRDFLARAGAGVFDEWAFRSTPPELRRDCFAPAGRCWALDERYKEGVSFQYHNLVTDPFPSQLNNLFAFDLILCRNVMIYFADDLVRKVLAGFHKSLVEGGWLLVGHAEPNVQHFQAFRTVNAPSNAVLYQKNAGEGSPAWEARPLPPVAAPQADAFLPFQPAPLPPVPRARPEPPPPAPRPEGGASEKLASVRSLADRGAWEEALEGCRELLATDRLEPLVHLCHGLVLEQTGRHADAEGALRRALYLDRRCVLAHYYLGLLLQKGHRPEDAARSFSNVLALLALLPPDRVFADGDGITAGELAKLARMNLEIMEKS